jgi:hypothetical protein
VHIAKQAGRSHDTGVPRLGGGAGVPLLYNDPEHWRKRADEAREIAGKMTDPKGKGDMLAIADKYEQLAQRALERLACPGGMKTTASVQR